MSQYTLNAIFGVSIFYLDMFHLEHKERWLIHEIWQFGQIFLPFLPLSFLIYYLWRLKSTSQVAPKFQWDNMHTHSVITINDVIIIVMGDTGDMSSANGALCAHVLTAPSPFAAGLLRICGYNLEITAPRVAFWAEQCMFPVPLWSLFILCLKASLGVPQPPLPHSHLN